MESEKQRGVFASVESLNQSPNAASPISIPHSGFWTSLPSKNLWHNTIVGWEQKEEEKENVSTRKPGIFEEDFNRFLKSFTLNEDTWLSMHIYWKYSQGCYNFSPRVKPYLTLLTCSVLNNGSEFLKQEQISWPTWRLFVYVFVFVFFARGLLFFNQDRKN